MKNQKLTNTLLGVIAINLTFLTLLQLNLFPTAYANSTSPVNANYGLVPLNPDGSISVKLSEQQIKEIKPSEVQKVIITTGYDEHEAVVNSYGTLQTRR